MQKRAYDKTHKSSNAKNQRVPPQKQVQWKESPESEQDEAADMDKYEEEEEEEVNEEEDEAEDGDGDDEMDIY